MDFTVELVPYSTVPSGSSSRPARPTCCGAPPAGITVTIEPGRTPSRSASDDPGQHAVLRK